MDLENYRFRYDAYKNNTFNLDAVEKSLDESKMSAYQYLRKFQLDSTGYKRFDFNMQEIYRTNKINHNTTLVPRKWVFFIEYEFINVGKRLAYKRSNLYEKDLSYDDIISRPDLFDSTFLVFVNGNLYTKGIQVLCKEDKTYLIITCKEEPSPEGFTISEMRELIDTNAKVTVFFIPNTGIKNINTNAYRIRTSNNGEGIPNRVLNLNESVDYNNSLTYLNLDGDIQSVQTESELTESGLYIDNDSINYLIEKSPNNTKLNIQLIPLRNLLMKINVNKGDKWFEIPMQDYPVAVENCLIFDNEGNFLHDASVIHYYPNVYSIENVDDVLENSNLTVYVFYYSNIFSVVKHLDMLAAYHKYVPDYLDRYRNGTINNIVKNFDPTIVDYDIKNFHKHDDYDDHFRYKISKMKEFIKADVNNFRRYLQNLGLGNNYYYVDVSKIDLESRRRKDNKDSKSRFVEFDEDKYMFVFRNDFRGMYDEIIIHVDGTRYQNIDVHKSDMLDYVYIPCDLVKPDTVLEIEKVTDVKKEFLFKSNYKSDIINLDIGPFAVRNKTLFNDLFIVDKATGKYLEPTDYQVIIPVQFHLDDMETDIVIDYIISETDGGYYRLANLEHGLVEVYKDDKPDGEINAYYLKAQDDKKQKVYQFDINEQVKAKFNEIDDFGNLINKVRSMNDKKIVYQFKVIDGKVKIDITEDDGTNNWKTVAEGGLDVIDLDEIFLPCPRKIKLRILNEEYLGKELSLHIKKNHNMEYIEEDRMYKDVVIYDIEGIKNTIPLFKDKLSSMYFEFEVKDMYILDNDNNIYKIDIVNNKITITENNTIMDKENSIIQKEYYVKDIINEKIYKIFLEDGILLTEEEHGDVDIIKFNIKDDNDKIHVLLSYDGKLASSLYDPYWKSCYDFYSIMFKTWSKNDSRYFRVYSNGRLIPRHLGKVVFKDYCLYNQPILYPGFRREPGEHYHLAVECMPYMMNQVCYLRSIPDDRVINLKGMLDKPFDFKWFDIYLNGKKLVRNEVEIISANIIKILKSDSLQWLEIIENSRDKEYFGDKDFYDIIDDLFENDQVFADNLNNSVKDLYDNEKPVVVTPVIYLDYILRQYYHYLVKKYGMINPDLVQISRFEIDQYYDLIDENQPFMLGMDYMGSNRIEEKEVLNINPDE